MTKSFELPQYSSSGSTLDRAFTAMLGTESNHRQLDNQGNPITSPKGAIGVAQVMPSTAPEAAKLAGLAWDEQAYRQDASYNAALGKAYFDKQVDTFGGDVAKGMAAYNAGPGRVRKAEQQALEQGGLWTDYLPKETQDYLRKNNAQLGAAQYPSATGTVPEVQPTLTQAKDLNQILAPVTLGEQKQQQRAQTTISRPMGNSTDTRAVNPANSQQPKSGFFGNNSGSSANPSNRPSGGSSGGLFGGSSFGG